MPAQAALQGIQGGPDGQRRFQRGPAVMGRRGQWVPPDHPEAMPDPAGGDPSQGGDPGTLGALHQQWGGAPPSLPPRGDGWDMGANGQQGGGDVANFRGPVQPMELQQVMQQAQQQQQPPPPDIGMDANAQALARQNAPQPPPPPLQKAGGGFLGLGHLPGLGFMKNAPTPPGLGFLNRSPAPQPGPPQGGPAPGAPPNGDAMANYQMWLQQQQRGGGGPQGYGTLGGLVPPRGPAQY